MNKSLSAIAGLILLAAPSIHAQGRNDAAQHASRPASGSPSAFNSRPGFGSRQAFYSRRVGYNRGLAFYHGNHYHGRGRGRYYYLGGVPYFYPYYDYGFGYPSYYGTGLGYGFATPYYGGYGANFGPGYDYYGAPSYDARLDERLAPGGEPADGQSLPAAVQSQLFRRGYYKGRIDGEFGDGSRTALRRFQKASKLKETGRIDEPTLRALGFADRR